MQLAWGLLKEGESVFSAALTVGYQSEAAFSRAFKQQFSINAGEVRRQASAQKSSLHPSL
jgi:AraC-like DNA-binding protein